MGRRSTFVSGATVTSASLGDPRLATTKGAGTNTGAQPTGAPIGHGGFGSGDGSAASEPSWIVDAAACPAWAAVESPPIRSHPAAHPSPATVAERVKSARSAARARVRVFMTDVISPRGYGHAVRDNPRSCQESSYCRSRPPAADADQMNHSEVV